MKRYKIAVMPGDGIGPEVVKQAVKFWTKLEQSAGFIGYCYADIGGVAIDKTGEPLPEETVQICKGSDAVLLGAVGE